MSADPKQPTISGVINTWNAAGTVSWAIRSLLSWVDEVVVVDMHSDDGTRQLAEEAGARVLLHEPVGYVEPAREFAVSQTESDWIMVLDADELVPEPLSRRLRQIARSDEADVVVLPRLNYMLGSPMPQCGWGPHQDRLRRFFRRGALLGPQALHSSPELAPGARELTLDPLHDEPIVHLAYIDLADFIERTNRYTSIEAREAQRRGESYRFSQMLRDMLLEIWRRYFVMRGRRAGWRGGALTGAMVVYRWLAHQKLREAEQEPPVPDIERRYAQIAERTLAAYGDPAPQSG